LAKVASLRRISPLLGVVLVIAACGSPTLTASPTGPIPRWPIDRDAVLDPARMVVTPAAAEAGELVSLTFPRADERGLLFAIDAATPDGWARRAMLLSDANGGEPQWSPADGEGLLVEMVGIGGRGPDRVPIPDDLPPGDYRICMANAMESVCVRIEIVDA
jgi:hypothetical protein